MRVLVVDDEPAARALARAVIAAAGHEVETAEGGEQALAQLEANSFDVLVTDAQMPVVDGLELARRVRRRSDRYVYVIMLTGLQDDHERLAGMHAGVDDYLTKPLRSAALASLLVAAARVVALHRQLEDQRLELERQATHDVLTGLLNRARLDPDLAALVDRHHRYGRPFSLALLDVDHFKAFNDTYGHQAGDDALRTVAQVISQVLRQVDAVYRYGGEEFLCLFPEQDGAGAAAAVDRIRAAVRAAGLVHTGAAGGFITISAGVAMCGPGADTPAALVAGADAALYAAKADGRDRVVQARPTAPCSVVS